MTRLRKFFLFFVGHQTRPLVRIVGILVMLIFITVIKIKRQSFDIYTYKEHNGVATQHKFNDSSPYDHDPSNTSSSAVENITLVVTAATHDDQEVKNEMSSSSTTRTIENSTVLTVVPMPHHDPEDVPALNNSSILTGGSVEPKEFCDYYIYKRTSGITCKARVSFIVARYHTSEEIAKSNLLKDKQNNCECNDFDKDIYNIRNKPKPQTIPNMFHTTSASEVMTTTSVNNHSLSDVLANQVFYQSPFHSHMKLRPSNYTHHNYYHDSTQSTYGKGANSNVRISFEMHDRMKVPLMNTFNLFMTCKHRFTGDSTNGILPPPLSRVVQNEDYPRGGRVLNFTATISTNLKILHIGDSVMVQLAQAFDEMVGCRNAATSGNGTGFCRPRVMLHEAWRGHEGRSILAPTIGGGVSAMWRMTGLLSRSNEGKPPANSPGGGWSMSEINSFFGPITSASDNTGSDDEQIDKRKHQGFDAVIFRVMHGWMRCDQITHDRLVEAVELSNELLGAETVILMTIPFTNNVLDADAMQKVKQINNDIRDIANGWHLRNSTGVKHVLVLEYGDYYNHIIWTNARYIGYNVTAPLMATNETFEFEGPTFLFDRLNSTVQWRPTISMVCSDLNFLGTEKTKCNMNFLFSDGMHICPTNLAARYGVATACLLGCVYNRKPSVENQLLDQIDEIKLRACERECNEQFMSVMPVDESWIHNHTEIASFS